MALTAFAATAFAIRPPRQADVVAQFRAHQEDYESLRHMIREDALVGVDDEGTSGSKGSGTSRSSGEGGPHST